MELEIGERMSRVPDQQSNPANTKSTSAIRRYGHADLAVMRSLTPMARLRAGTFVFPRVEWVATS